MPKRDKIDASEASSEPHPSEDEACPAPLRGALLLRVPSGGSTGLVRAALALSTAALACASEKEPLPPPPPTVLIVRVMDAVTGGPIDGARVLVDLDGRWRSTDPEGVIRVELSRAGIARLFALAAAHLPSPSGLEPPSEVSVAEAATTEARLWLDPRPGSTGRGTLEGTVTAGGQPLPGALVVASSTLDLYGWADAEGLYALPGLNEARFTVTAHLGGYRLAMPVSVEGASMDVVTGNLDLEPEPSASLEGTLEGTGTSSVVLSHPAVGVPIPGLFAVATAGSAWRIAGVAPGSYDVSTGLELDGRVLDPELGPNGKVPIRAGEGPVALRLVAAVPGIRPTGGEEVPLPLEIVWDPVPGAGFYVVAVEDAAGRTIWGGFDAEGQPRARVLPPETRARYDGPALVPGARYQARVHAGEVDPIIPSRFTRVAASEALAGRFRVLGR